MLDVIGVERYRPAQLIVYGGYKIGEPAEIIFWIIPRGGERLLDSDEALLSHARFHHTNVRVGKVVKEFIFGARRGQHHRLYELSIAQSGMERL